MDLESRNNNSSITDVFHDSGHLTRSQIVLIVGVVLLIVVCGVLMYRNFASISATRDAFQHASFTTVIAANVQREALQLQTKTLHWFRAGDASDISTLETQRAFLENQLQALARQLQDDSTSTDDLTKIRALLVEYDRLIVQLQGEVGAGSLPRTSPTMTQIEDVLAELEHSVKVLYDHEEFEFFGRTATALRAQRSSQALLLGIGVGLLVVSGMLVFSLSRSVSSEFKNAYRLLQEEVAERRKTEAQLRKSEERYALAVRGANDGLWDWRLDEGTIYYSPRWKAMLGYDEEAIGSTPDEWMDRVHEEDREQLEVDINRHRNGQTSHFENEHRILHADGSYRWVLSRGLAVRDDDGNAYRMAGSLTDITDQKRIEQELTHTALHDTLTDLPNRALFLDSLENAHERRKRNDDYEYAVLFIDVDRFKTINDSLGHMIGDQLLIAVANRLARCIRGVDKVARLGGDEFAVLLDNIQDISNATRVARRIKEEFSDPFEIGGHTVFVSASIGIALSETGYDKADEILRDADIAMYRAKETGNGKYEIFDQEMFERARSRLELEADLRNAIDRSELELHYQPIISLETGMIFGCEALLRWHHPRRGFIPPGEFIPIAEETGDIIRIGQWVLQEACWQMAQWQEQFPEYERLMISVNISSVQIAYADFVQELSKTLATSGLDAGSLSLEITESMIVGNSHTVRSTLTQLRDMYIQLHIDDFGTGYTSLSYLHRFPVDALKIDKSFIREVPHNQKNLDVVETIAVLAGKLDADVIAEGVETAEQLAQLRALGCQYAQGYFFARPATGKEMTKLLSKLPRW